MTGVSCETGWITTGPTRSTSNVAGGIDVPSHFSTWRWRGLADPILGDDDRGSNVYAANLERQPVEKTLLRLSEIWPRAFRIPVAVLGNPAF